MSIKAVTCPDARSTTATPPGSTPGGTYARPPSGGMRGVATQAGSEGFSWLVKPRSMRRISWRVAGSTTPIMADWPSAASATYNSPEGARSTPMLRAETGIGVSRAESDGTTTAILAAMPFEK